MWVFGIFQPKAVDSGRWAHFNVKLFHFFLSFPGQGLTTLTLPLFFSCQTLISGMTQNSRKSAEKFDPWPWAGVNPCITMFTNWQFYCISSPNLAKVEYIINAQCIVNSCAIFMIVLCILRAASIYYKSEAKNQFTIPVIEKIGLNPLLTGPQHRTYVYLFQPKIIFFF